MTWRRLPESDYFLFARSYKLAAKEMAAALATDHPTEGEASEFDLAPVLSLYRHTIELHLKVIVLGPGGNFLAAKPDALSVRKTRSLAWLGQFVSQVVIALHWEREFTNDRIRSLAEFKSVLEQANEIDATCDAFRYPTSARSEALDFLRHLDALIDLLENTADQLAAEWHLRSERSTAFDAEWPDGPATIQ